MAHDRERLVYLFGEETLAQLDDFDLDDESGLMLAVERFLPVPAGPSSGARRAIRTVAVTQILNDDPPEAWRAVERMRAAGLERDVVLGQLSMVISGHLRDALDSDEPPDPARLIAGLDALPMPTTDDAEAALVAVARLEPGIGADDLVTRASERLGSGVSRRITETMIDHVLEHLVEGPLQFLAGDTTVVFHDAIAGRTFTHRFSEPELDLGIITVSVGLAAFGRFDVVRLPDGTELDQFSVERGHLAWAGPDGWLDAYHDGDLIAVTASFEPPVGDEPVEATITITLVTEEPAVTDGLASAVRAAYDREQYEHGLSVTAEELVVSLCHHDPGLFTRPLPPLSEWFEMAGLDLNGNKVAHDESVWREDLLQRRTYQVFDAVPEQRWRVIIGKAVDELADPDASVDDVRTCLAECAEPEALDVLADVLIPELLEPADEFQRDRVESPGHVFELVQRATAVARRPREVATAEYLACVLHERCGQPLIAAEHLARAVDAQPRLGPVVERMGWYCFDRGDARGARRWWSELDEEHEGMGVLAPILAPPGGRAKLGRNDPCWCGSGRKFKQCHQGRADLPALPDRIAWLCRKASLWIDHSIGDARRLVTELAIAWVAGDPDADDSDVMDDDDSMREQFGRAFSDPIIFDVALHEGGLFGRFLRERGGLLPDDEQLLATAWLTVERSVHEVVSIDRGTGMTLRNLATGDVVDVRERAASTILRVGERWCARVAPDGTSHQIIGGIFPVRTGHEQVVLDLCDNRDPRGLCAWAGALAQPPRVVRQPGLLDSMIDRDAIQAALDDLGDADDATVMATLNAEFSRQAEAHWLDENVPALGGLTPRQAAADPTRREQLERLLDEFDHLAERITDADVIGGAITYDTAALRHELGLT